MKYDKQRIDVYVMVYYLGPNNIHDVVKTDLNMINRFLVHYILTSLNIENIEIRKQFHNFKF